MLRAQTKGRVFVTDGAYPNALAAVRALGRAGFEVTVAERDGIALPEVVSFWSRHCAHRVRYPDPRSDRRAAMEFLTRHLGETGYDAALPIGLEMTRLFVEAGAAFAVPTLLPSQDAFCVASDKRFTFPHCAAIGIPVPRTLPAREWRELDTPLVFKHRSSGARIVRSIEQAESFAAELGAKIENYLAQEYIPGENGFGYFGFFRHGREQGFFMHQRLVQLPKEGGPSVLARAIKDDTLRELGRRTLESLQWTGVAMVEFKRSDRDGRLYLMEINPKFWGSLDLAIQSGCNFPVWVAQALISGKAPEPTQYDIGTHYQWVVPNALKCFVRYPECRGALLRNMLTPAVKKDIQLHDPLPSAAGLMAMAFNWSKR
jgi:predicted ATP-grasp superfamily ATP-dependent carboligase